MQQNHLTCKGQNGVLRMWFTFQWILGVHDTEHKHPWYAPGTAPISSPCGTLGIDPMKHISILLILCPILVAALVYQMHRISSIQLPSLISSFDHCHHINIRWLASWLQFWWHWQFWGLLPGEISEIISFILIAARAPTVVDLLLEKMRNSISYHNDGQWMENGDDNDE